MTKHSNITEFALSLNKAERLEALSAMSREEKLKPSGRKCRICGEDLPVGREMLMPDSQRCVKHATTAKVAGHTLITGKNEYSAIQIVTQEMSAALRSAGNRKGQGVVQGARMKGK